MLRGIVNYIHESTILFRYCSLRLNLELECWGGEGYRDDWTRTAASNGADAGVSTGRSRSTRTFEALPHVFHIFTCYMLISCTKWQQCFVLLSLSLLQNCYFASKVNIVFSLYHQVVGYDPTQYPSPRGASPGYGAPAYDPTQYTSPRGGAPGYG